MTWVPLAIFVGLMVPLFLVCWKFATEDAVWPMALVSLWCLVAAVITDALAGALHIKGY